MCESTDAGSQDRVITVKSQGNPKMPFFRGTSIFFLCTFACFAAEVPEDLSDTASVTVREKDPVPSSMPPGLSDYTLHLVGHAHIDPVYRWRWNETVHRVARDTFRGVLGMMEKEPGLTFVQSQMALYEAMQVEYPAIFEEIKRRIVEGRWRVICPTWTEMDNTMPCGESFVRNFLYGIDYCRKQLGVDPRIAFGPDSFSGCANTLPQIFKGCGMEYYIPGRGQLDDKKIFWWEGTDSSRILCCSLPWTYSVNLGALRSRNPLQMFDAWSKAALGIRDIMVFFGQGDHGGGPRDSDIDVIRALQQDKNAPRLVYDTPEMYLEQIIDPLRDRVPVHNESLAGFSAMSYASQARAKQYNRYCENLLLTAEKFNALGTLYQRKPNFPRVDFNEAWKPVMLYQFHDAIPGTSNGRVYDDAADAYAAVIDEGRTLLRQGLEYIGSRIDTRGEGVPVVVYNPIAWERTDAVEAEIRFVQPVETFTVKDSTGQEVLQQPLWHSEDGTQWRALVLAPAVPSIGYRTLRAFPGQSPPRTSPLKASVDSLENEYLKVQLAADGSLKSVYDKQAGREALSGSGNTLSLLLENVAGHEEGASSSWNSVLTGEKEGLQPLAGPELIESGPVRAIVRSRYRAESSVFQVDTIVYAGVPRVDFAFDCDWHERDKLLVVEFPTTVTEGLAAISKPYGYNEYAPAGRRDYGQQWVDVSNAGYGVSLLSDSKYEYWVDGGTLRMSLVRGSRDMDPRMDEGKHQFQYALYPHAGSWKTAATVAQARALNNPLIALQEPPHIGTNAGWGSRKNNYSLPQDLALVSVDATNVDVPVVKIDHDAWTIPEGWLVVRLFETAGRATTGWISFPMSVETAMVTNLIEEPVPDQKVEKEGKRLQFNLRANEVKTYRVLLSDTGS